MRAWPAVKDDGMDAWHARAQPETETNAALECGFLVGAGPRPVLTERRPARSR